MITKTCRWCGAEFDAIDFCVQCGAADYRAAEMMAVAARNASPARAQSRREMPMDAVGPVSPREIDAIMRDFGDEQRRAGERACAPMVRGGCGRHAGEVRHAGLLCALAALAAGALLMVISLQLLF